MPQEDDNEAEETPLIKQLRQQLKDKGDQIANLTATNRTLTGRTTLASAGFAYLNDIQQQAVLHMLGDTEVTPETVTATASQLGYQVQAPQQPQDQNQGQPQGQPQDQPQNLGYPQVPQTVPQVPFQGQPQAQPWNQVPSMPNYGTPPGTATNGANAPVNPAVQSAQAMNQMSQAQQYGQPPAQASFQDRLKAAKSPEEVTALIRSEGQNFGMMHEYDVE